MTATVLSVFGRGRQGEETLHCILQQHQTRSAATCVGQLLIAQWDETCEQL